MPRKKNGDGLPMPQVFNQDGQGYALGEKIGGGAQGEVFSLPALPDRVVKLFLPPFRTGEEGKRLQGKLAALRDKQLAGPLPEVAWPEFSVFDGEGQWSGYVMRRLPGISLADQILSPRRLLEEWHESDRRLLAGTAAAFLETLRRLHQADVWVGDFNPGNFLFTPRQGRIAFIDVDSYQMAAGASRYGCALTTPGMMPPEHVNVRIARQWTLRRERVRYEAERARRQYDAVEPENRLVARSLERGWEERLRVMERIEQDYAYWRQEQPLSLTETDRAAILALGEDLPWVWHAATTTAAERKRILRLVVQEVVLDQKRCPGQVYIRILWQTGATSEQRVRRRVRGYSDHADLDRLERRVRELNGAGKMDAEIANALNIEGFVSTRGTAFGHGLVYLLRKRWGIATVKINGTGENPACWSDGSYSVQGAAAALGVTVQTIFKWLKRGRLSGHQLAKGMPWQIALAAEKIPELRSLVRRTSPSKRKAS